MKTATLAAFSCALFLSQAAFAADGIEFFEKQVRPLLAAKCHSCHSSKSKQTFAGLALDSRAGLARGSDSGPVIASGRPEDSKLIRAIQGKTPVPMPPTGRLSDEQITTLSRWVEMGAPWPEEAAADVKSQVFDLDRRKREHWAWRPVKAVPLPTVRKEDRPLQPSDRFLVARLEKEGLHPAQAADPATLLRRVTFDLTGLPPSASELDAFLTDKAPDRYQRVVDRLLASPRFGERWARHWMDLVRYAESHGSEGDPDIPMAWRYRDYLIRAFNSDVPYDQLIREHIAGDLLPLPRRNDEDRVNESLIGVTHFRLIEHGFQPVDPWEDRIKWTDNQIDVFAKAFQGLTVSCARCHDHKFDAISQKDYYALFGIFASARPTQAAIDLPEDLHRNRADLIAAKREIQKELAGIWKKTAGDLADRLKQTQPRNKEGVLQPWLALRDRQGEEFRIGWQQLAGKFRKDLQQRNEFNTAHFQKVWDLRGPDYGVWLRRGTGLPAQPSSPGDFWILPEGDRIVNGIYPVGVYTNLLSNKHNGVLSSPRFKIDSETVSVRMLGGNYSFAQLIVENYAVPRGGIYALRVAGRKDEMGWYRWDTTFWKGFTGYIELATMDDATHILVEAPADKKSPRTEPVKNGRSWFGVQAVWFGEGKMPPMETTSPAAVLFSGTPPNSRDDLAQRYASLLREVVDAWLAGTISDEQTAFLNGLISEDILPASLDRLEGLRVAVARYRTLEAEVPVARRAPCVMEEGGADQPLLVRGNPRNPGPAVPRSYLEALGDVKYAGPMPSRLQLANAIASPSNPLTARVMVNRLWQQIFGAGLVRTVDNFGKLGEGPSHPELLDWLADRFVVDGWSVRKMIRTLVLSRAYQMSSTASAEAMKTDPQNRLLQHMPVRRLDAEAIRDSMLQASGQLDLTMYGPSVPTYYAHDTGKTKGDRPKGPLDGNGRRSIYLEVRRNVTNPFLETFDFPIPTSTRGERDLTNVPAQSLALLNNPFVIEQASRWAARELSIPGSSDADRIDRMFRSALGRSPSAQERDEAHTFLADLRAEHSGAEDAVWRDFGHALFNLKEFIYIR